jgi:hypothetical protein
MRAGMVALRPPGALVSNHSKKPMRLARRAVALTVCYVIVAQAFVAGLATTLALGRADVAAGTSVAIVCHGVGPAGQGRGDTVDFQCTHCAITACGLLLSVPTPTIAALPQLVAILGFIDSDEISAPPPARAGLARAPPTFA